MRAAGQVVNQKFHEIRIDKAEQFENTDHSEEPDHFFPERLEYGPEFLPEFFCDNVFRGSHMNI